MPIDYSFIENNAPQIEEPKKDGVNVTLRVDANCMFKCDGEEVVSKIVANNTVKVHLSVGQHLLEFISLESSNARIDKQVDYSEKGKNYIEIVEGLEELVNKLPLSDFISVKQLEFANTNKAGDFINDYDSELVDATLKFLKPQMTYSCNLLSERKVTVYKKIIHPSGKVKTDASSPDGYTSKEEITLQPGENNQLTLSGWGTEIGGSYSVGEYKYQLWNDDIMFYETTFVVKNILDFIQVEKIEFANTKDGKIINDYGSELINASLNLKPRMTYSCKLQTEQEITFERRCITPSGFRISFNSKTETITFQSGENNLLTLSGWEDGLNSAGKYKYQLWYNGTMFYETTFVVKNIMDYIHVKQFEFANTNQEGKIINDYGSELVDTTLKYLKPKMTYSCKLLSERKLTIYKKIIRPNGKVDSGSSSPEGYTSKEAITLKPGENNQLTLSGWGTETGGSYSAGRYKYQLWYNGTMFYETIYDVKKKNPVLEVKEKNPVLEVKEKNPVLNIKSVQLASLHRDTIVSDFGKSLKQVKGSFNEKYIDRLNAKIEYESDESLVRDIVTNVFFPSGENEIIRHYGIRISKGHGTFYLIGILKDSFRYSIVTGTYTCEIYCSNVKLYSFEFSIEKRILGIF